jgi:hypothetical protein
MSFWQTTDRHAAGHGLPLAEYEGAAVEWFLLGLVELPPAGVNLVIKDA